MLQICIKFKFDCSCHSGPKTTKYNVGCRHWYEFHTPLPERCLNAGPQSWTPTLRHCSHHIGWILSWRQSIGSDICTTLTHRCLHVVSMTVPYIGKQHCHNIHTTLCMMSHHWSPTLVSDIATMFTQHCLNNTSPLANISHYCDNIVAMLGLWLKYNIGTVVPRQWPTSANSVTTLWQCWDFGWNITLVQCSHNIVWSSVQHCWDVWKYLQMRGLTLRQRWHQRCHNIATMLEY